MVNIPQALRLAGMQLVCAIKYSYIIAHTNCITYLIIGKTKVKYFLYYICTGMLIINITI